MADGILSVGADVSPMIRDVRGAYAKLQNEISSKGFSIDTSRAGRSLSSLTQQSERLARSLTRSSEVFLSIASVSSAIYGTQRAFSALVQSVRETELAFAQIQSILQASSSNFKTFQSTLFQVANQTGTAFSQAAEVANEFARQGLSLNDTLVRTKDALTLVRLSGLSTADAVSSLTAIVNTFKNEALTSSQAVEKLATVSAAYAVSEQDLALALQRTGAAAADSGASFNQLISVISALQERTARGGSVIGNGLKSIFTRTQSTETLDLLESLGVAVRDLEGNTLPILDVLDSLADKFQGLSSSQKSAVTEATAGIYQVNTLQALLADLSSEYSIYTSALDKSATATDQATIRNQRLNETLDALFVRTGNNLQQFNSDFGKVSIEPVVRKVLDGLNQIFEGFNKFQNTDFGEGILKGIGDVLSGPALVLVTATIFKIGNALRKGFQEALKDLSSLSGFGTKYQLTQEQIVNVLKSQDQAHQKIIASAKTEQQQAEAILRVARMISAEYKEAASYFALTSANVNLVARGKPVPNRAGGFLPISSAIAKEQEMIQRGVGGASAGAKPVVLENFNTGRGRETVVANSDEIIVKNFNGTGASAILTKEMVEKFGGIGNVRSMGSVSKVGNAAGGLVGPDNKFLKFSPENAKQAINLKEFSKALKESEKALEKQVKALSKIQEIQNPRKVAKAQKELNKVNSRLSQGQLAPRSVFTPDLERNLLTQRRKLLDVIEGVPKDLRKKEAQLAEVRSKQAIVQDAAKKQTPQQKKAIKALNEEREAKKASQALKKQESDQKRLQAQLLKEEEDEYQKFKQSRLKKSQKQKFETRFNLENGISAPLPLSESERYEKIKKDLADRELQKSLEQRAKGELGLIDAPETFDDKVKAEEKRRASIEEARKVRETVDSKEKAAREAKIKEVREGRAAVLAGRDTPRTLLTTGSKEYKERLKSLQEKRFENNQARYRKKNPEVVALEKRAKFNAGLERSSTALLLASLGIPIAAQAFKNGKGGTNDQVVDTASSALSTGAAIFSAFPNKIGLGAGLLAGGGIAAKGFFDINGSKGDSAEVLGKEAEELANKNNELTNSIRAYISAQGQLEDAIAAGASSDAVSSLTRVVNEALFGIEDSNVRKSLQDASSAKNPFDARQKIIDSVSGPNERKIAEKEFAQSLRAFDDELASFDDKIIRTFGGEPDNLKNVGLTEADSLVNQLLKALGPKSLLSSESIAENFLKGGGGDFLKDLGLEDASKTMKIFEGALGDSADILKRKLAIEIIESAEVIKRRNAQNSLTQAILVAKKDLEGFVSAISTASKSVNENFSRNFNKSFQQVSNKAFTGISPTADAFRDFGLNRANLINEASNESRNLRTGLIDQITQAGIEGKFSQEQSKKLVDALNNSFQNTKSGDLGLKDLVNIIKEGDDKDVLQNSQLILATEKLGLDLEASLSELQNKLSSDLEKIKKTNQANLFGGLGAVGKGPLFKESESLFSTQLEANNFLDKKLPRTKDSRQKFAEESFAIRSKFDSASLREFNERLENGVEAQAIESQGRKILSEYLNSGGTISKDSAIEKIRALVPNYKELASAQERLISGQATSSFGSSLDSFVSDLPKNVQGRTSVKSRIKELKDSIAAGASINDLNLDGLSTSIYASRDKNAIRDFESLKARKENLGKQVSGASGSGEAALDLRLGISEMIASLDALDLASKDNKALETISSNTGEATKILQSINGAANALSSRFVTSSISSELRQAELNLLDQTDAKGSLTGAKAQRVSFLEDSASKIQKQLDATETVTMGGRGGVVSYERPSITGESREKLEESLKSLQTEINILKEDIKKSSAGYDPSVETSLKAQVDKLFGEVIKATTFGPPRPEGVPSPSPYPDEAPPSPTPLGTPLGSTRSNPVGAQPTSTFGVPLGSMRLASNVAPPAGSAIYPSVSVLEEQDRRKRVYKELSRKADLQQQVREGLINGDPFSTPLEDAANNLTKRRLQLIEGTAKPQLPSATTTPTESTSNINISVGDMQLKIEGLDKKALPENLEIIVQQEISKFKENLKEVIQRGLDSLAKNNNLKPVVP